MTDFETFMFDNEFKIFRYWVYKKTYTPYEQEKKYSDQSEFVSDTCTYGRIDQSIELPDGDILIGFALDIDDDTKIIEYHKLSDIKIMYCESDNE